MVEPRTGGRWSSLALPVVTPGPYDAAMASIKKRMTAGGQTRWDARVRIGAKVITKTHRTRELAQTWARQQEDAARSGEWSDPSLAKQSLADYGAAWIDTRRVRQGQPLAPRTKEVYIDLLERRMESIGAVELRHLTPEVVRKWYADQPPGPYTAKGYRLLRSICATAVDDGILRRQPCRIDGGGRESSPERPLITPDELASLVQAADPRLRALVLLAGWCGLRSGELLALERRHFDLLHRVVHVDQSVQSLKGQGRTLLPTKSDAGQRAVDMPVLVAEACTVHLHEYVTAPPTSPFAVGRSKRPVQPRTLWRWWNDARVATGLGHYHFHDLRHAAGTMAAWTGATQAEIQARLGQASGAAAARYQHAAKERNRDLADALDAIARGEFTRRIQLRPRDGRAMDTETTEAQEDAG
ncbi:MAG: Integrase, Lambda phage type [Acidimicrobiales bacterium]|nr:Integrase, Lambda phage type [Acidimicrobiales bacterium]